MKRSFGGENNAKKQKTLLGLDLPVHLPNQQSAPAAQNENHVLDEEPDVLGPMFIEGTNIMLRTEEDIEKWIEERKRNWPTRKNIEEKKRKYQEAQAAPAPQSNNTQNTQNKNVCRFYAKNRKCRFGNKCKNLHQTGQPSQNSNAKMINGLLVNIPQRYKNELPPDIHSSLYKKLVQRDLYEHENNIVLDFIKYLDSINEIDHSVSA